MVVFADNVALVPWSPESVSSSHGEPYPIAPINEAVLDVGIAPLESSVIPRLGGEPLIQAMPGNFNFIDSPAGTTASGFLRPGSGVSVLSTEQILVVNYE